MIVPRKLRMIDRGRSLRRNKQIIMSHSAGMSLVAAITSAAAVAAAERKQEVSSRSATNRRVNEPNAQINRRGRAKITRWCSREMHRGYAAAHHKRHMRERACVYTRVYVCRCEYARSANRSNRRTRRSGNSSLWPPERGQATLTPLNTPSPHGVASSRDNDIICELENGTAFRLFLSRFFFSLERSAVSDLTRGGLFCNYLTKSCRCGSSINECMRFSPYFSSTAFTFLFRIEILHRV